MTEDEPRTNKVLGALWNVRQDKFHFDIHDVVDTMEDSVPTKTNVASATARFYNSLGVVSPVTILFKVFYQQLCKARFGWDETLSGSLLMEWKHLPSVMKTTRWFITSFKYSEACVGLCDAPSKAYADVVYTTTRLDLLHRCFQWHLWFSWTYKAL